MKYLYSILDTYILTYFAGNTSVISAQAIGVNPADEIKLLIRKSINTIQDFNGSVFVQLTLIRPILYSKRRKPIMQIT